MAQAHLPPPYPTAAYPGPPYEQHKPALQTNGQGMPMGSSAVQVNGPTPFSGIRDNWQFTLVVEQQPVRARMCGFGDKDRRPITPPPCVRIIVMDVRTQKEVPLDQVDASFFILQVDLWDETGSCEKNVVKAATNSPATSISTATTTSYPPPPDRPAVYAQAPVAYHNPYTGAITHQPHPAYPPPPHMYSQPSQIPPMYAPAPPGGYYQPMPPGYPYPGAHPMSAPLYQPQYAPPMGGQPQPQGTGMFTRNLIGSLTVNAFLLRDTKGREGFWFILQDLSVRTEGNFRLKMNFVDVGVGKSEGRSVINQGKCPVLASVFSQPFQVFSAKKFPGVIESTELSKAFAAQGIKIPIRKDGGKHDKDDDDD